MSDFKSKLPDLKELGEITGKLFKDIKTSVGEIIGTYKQKHAEAAVEQTKEVKAETVATKAEEPKAEKAPKEKAPDTDKE